MVLLLRVLLQLMEVIEKENVRFVTREYRHLHYPLLAVNGVVEMMSL